MKVLLINGSPHKQGCTYTALSEVAGPLHAHGIETEFFHIGDGPIWGCTGCGGCAKTVRCVFAEDGVNVCVEKLIQADGVVIGSPVYYAGPNGALCAFLDRLFFRKSHHYAYKPAAAVVNCRRGGASAAFDRLNKYFTLARMPVVSSQYWNSTHGFTPDQVRQDIEGLQTMRTLGKNMAWMLRAIAREGTREIGAEEEEVRATNFIR
ncbi:MAG: flavodoxin family protein [Spirochaetaceae bacterium]|jgi:multimeric flavodoxin WrbA|nr:flavodoxin family protein [Spirochaetaceae bacterium]